MSLLKRFLYVTCLTILFSFFSNCATYNVKSQKFQKALQSGKTEEALNAVDDNPFLLKKRNLLLYYLEKGKIFYLKGDYEMSNSFFNKADAFIEENKEYTGGKILGTILNPEKETYLGEDFEKVAIHYYKALNYIFLNKYDDALVEAKRINLQLQRINDQYSSNQKNRYSSDGFSLSLQGMIYEAVGDINNAFISYREAVDLYLKNSGLFFGTTLPEQLKKDLLRTASHLGFADELIRYQKLLKINYKKEEIYGGGELVLFWENGLAPYKDQIFYTFAILPGNKTGIVSVRNEELDLTLPLPLPSSNSKSSKFSDIDVFNVAFPKYVQRKPYFKKANIKKDSTYANSLELAQNYDRIAFKTLEDRTLREVGKAALRLGTKKVSEYLVRNENENIGTALGIFNALTERADTRNWQSLPHSIYYARIPLKKGDNIISLDFIGNSMLKKEIVVKGKSGIQFRKITTLQSLSTGSE